MSDIVERLRDLKSIWPPDELRKEAAAEIGRLRRLLASGREQFSSQGAELDNAKAAIERLREWQSNCLRAETIEVENLKAEIERLQGRQNEC